MSNAGDLPEERPLWSNFASRFERKFGHAPTVVAGRAYDVTNLVLDALAKGTLDSGRIAQEVRNTHDYDGVTGPITFDEHGDNAFGTLAGYRIEGGRFVRDRVLQP